VTDHPTVQVLKQVLAERHAQDKKWGEQNHPDGTGGKFMELLAAANRSACNKEFAEGRGTWFAILQEEVSEAFAEADPEKLRTELIQVAAVAVAWVEKLNREGTQR
jgi:hypothetical protein